MTSGPGTIIISQVTDALYTSECSGFGAGSSPSGNCCGGSIPSGSCGARAFACVRLSVRLTDAELLESESRLRLAAIKSCCSLESRCSARFGAFSPATTAGVPPDCHPWSQTFNLLGLCYSESCGQAQWAFGRFPFMEPPIRLNRKSV